MQPRRRRPSSAPRTRSWRSRWRCPWSSRAAARPTRSRPRPSRRATCRRRPQTVRRPAGPIRPARRHPAPGRGRRRRPRRGGAGTAARAGRAAAAAARRAPARSWRLRRPRTMGRCVARPSSSGPGQCRELGRVASARCGRVRQSRTGTGSWARLARAAWAMLAGRASPQQQPGSSAPVLLFAAVPCVRCQAQRRGSGRAWGPGARGSTASRMPPIRQPRAHTPVQYPEAGPPPRGRARRRRLPRRRQHSRRSPPRARPARACWLCASRTAAARSGVSRRARRWPPCASCASHGSPRPRLGSRLCCRRACPVRAPRSPRAVPHGWLAVHDGAQPPGRRLCASLQQLAQRARCWQACPRCASHPQIPRCWLQRTKLPARLLAARCLRTAPSAGLQQCPRCPLAGPMLRLN